MSAVAIPKRLGHIWVGDRPAPKRWMQSWRDLHRDWAANTFYDNAYLAGWRWRNQRLISHCFNARRIEVVADLMGHEIHSAFANTPKTLHQPWISVGALFLCGLLEKYRKTLQDLRIWSAYYFIPHHKEGPHYDGNGPVHANHHWGTTLDKYETGQTDPQLYHYVAFVLNAHDPLPLSHSIPEGGVGLC